MGLIAKLFGTRSEREVKRIIPTVDRIEAMGEEMKALSDEALRDKTAEFKERYEQGETLDQLLPEAFAVCREAAHRVLGMRPYRVQLIGGIILHQGRIAEMKTGEGKTLVAILPAYLNALSGNGVHIVTVNDYLAKRDSEWMGKVYRFLGLKVGLIIHGLTPNQRREAYQADITYCTNNELGFDYLRDNMALYKQEMVQRGHNFAIVDEVDSILIDEARTPLIISGQGEESTKLYEMADMFVSGLRKRVFATTDEKQEQDDLDCDYYVEEKSRTANLTASGIEKAERYFGVENLGDIENTTLMHHINQAMKARGVMKRDIDYVVKDGQVIIVDEFTGRLMYGRRYNEGLHQAIEAKENVSVAHESRTLATITFQNFFRLYEKLSGMTGTALSEQEEFNAIYKLDIVEIPTNKPIARKDLNDTVYKTETAKFHAVIEQIKECHEKGQPVLVGTVSIEKSEFLSKLLKREGVKHTVLNAKHHDKEAEIVAQAGKFGSVTISTNMAGRGTDIMLGGNAEYMALSDLRKKELPDALIAEANSYAETDDPEILAVRQEFKENLARHKAVTDAEAQRVREVGGLFIIGTERHESRRIDNQLRGRAGRQGDPGATRFFLSLEDDVMRLFGSERVMNMMNAMGMDEDTPIDAKMLSGAIENAQKTVESRNFQSRKSVLEYDDVMNKQRTKIYENRQLVLDGKDLSDKIIDYTHYVIDSEVDPIYANPDYETDEARLAAICEKFEGLYIAPGSYTGEKDAQAAKDRLYELFRETYSAREAMFGSELMREVERIILLQVVDESWMDHIVLMDDLKQGIRLRAYGQENPVLAYQREASIMYSGMNDTIKEETVRRLYMVRPKANEEVRRKKVAKITGTGAASDKTVKQQPVRKIKIGPTIPAPAAVAKSTSVVAAIRTRPSNDHSTKRLTGISGQPSS